MPAPPPLEGGKREEADIDKSDPLEDRPPSLRCGWLAASDQSLVSRRVEQLEAALRTKREQHERVSDFPPPLAGEGRGGGHHDSRISASSIERPGPSAIASTRPFAPLRCISSSTKKMPALDALPLPANTDREVASASG